MDTRKLKIGVVGLGAWGRTWVDVVRQSPEWDLAFVADPRGEAAAGLDEIAAYAGVEEALDRETPDAVLVATPPSVRADVIGPALERDVCVLVEKPLAATPEDARAIVALASASPHRIMVSQNYRFSEHVRAIGADVAAAGGFLLGSYRYAMDASFMQGVYRARMPDCLAVEMCVHHWDLMRFIAGGDPVRVFARSWNPPASWSDGDGALSALFEWADGRTWSYAATWSAPMNRTGWFGDASIVSSQAEWRLGEAESERHAPGEPVRRVPAMGNEETRRRVLTAFADALEAGERPPCDVHDNVGTLAMVFGAIESGRTHRVVDLEMLSSRLRAPGAGGSP